MTEGRFLGLDIGTKRIGIAVSDPLFITAQPVNTIMRQPEQKSVEEIKQLCKQYNVSYIVAGLPVNMDGSFGFQAEDVQKYSVLLEKEIQKQIIFEDERLTSYDAERILIEQGRKPSRNKALIDMVAAAIILQQYLDKRR
ncbi:MAG: Holliday junction resolvase RuvX [Candidatus Gastranaerophilales bacterium]|nr:Holliday junction resolvase RuvX [Candidatus Gastranaerophilales bacterium]